MNRWRPLLATCLVAILSISMPVGAGASESDRASDDSRLQVAQRADDVYVNGYHRRDGTYVSPHRRSAPDGNPSNNYSFPGNTNPYTGKVAPGNPDTYLRSYGGGSYPRSNPYGDLYGK